MLAKLLESMEETVQI